MIVPAYLRGFETKIVYILLGRDIMFQHTYEGSKHEGDAYDGDGDDRFQHTYEGSKLWSVGLF